MSRRIQLPPLTIPVESDAQVRRRAIGRARFLGTTMLLVLGVVGLRGVQLSVLPTDRVKLEVAVQRWDTVIMEAPRGPIVDRNNHRLAVSRATAHVVADPSMIPPSDLGRVSAELTEVLGRKRAEWRVRLENPKQRYRVLVRDVHPRRAKRAAEIHDAIYLEEPPTRFYPEGSLAAHLIGFVNSEGIGREGLEVQYQSYLEGGVLVQQRRRDRLGSSVDDPTERASFHEGMTVHLTLDRSIQQMAEAQLAEVWETSSPEGATVVVVDVPTGDLLALANAPTFDPNHLQGPALHRRNRGLEYAQELGSVLKPLTVAAAVDAGVIPHTGLVDCSPPLILQGKEIHDTHPVGIASLRTLLAHSSNIGAGRLGLALGADRLVSYARRFGLGQRTGLGLPAEVAGTVHDADSLGRHTVASMGFGQGVAVTPLQLAMAIASLGNEGKLMKPRLVTQVVDAHGVTEVVTRPEVVRQVVAPEVAKAVLHMMVGVTEDEGATGVAGRIDGITVAGKTGTAQKALPGGRGYGPGRIASFVSLVPADSPRVAVVVVIDDPDQGSHAGGDVAAPVAARVAEHALRVLGVHPVGDDADRGFVGDLPPASARRAGDASLAWVGVGWRMPDLTGQVARDAARLVAAADLTLAAEGHGRVVAQRPSAGQVVPPGGVVTLTLR